MKTTNTLAFFALSFSCFSTAHAAPVAFDWATVGNPGNADDIHGDGYGGVDYTYRISKTEVTNAQYVEFLNAVADSDPNSLNNISMNLSTRGGIKRSGSSGSYTYAVKSDSIGNGPGGTDYTYGNKPVVYVSFFDAMRFTNWLENGQPIGEQNTSTTEAGAYIIGNRLNEVRDRGFAGVVPCVRFSPYRLSSANRKFAELSAGSSGSSDNVATSNASKSLVLDSSGCFFFSLPCVGNRWSSYYNSKMTRPAAKERK